MAEVSNKTLQVLLQSTIAQGRLMDETLAVLIKCIPYVPIEMVLEIKQLALRQTNAMSQVLAIIEEANRGN